MPGHPGRALLPVTPVKPNFYTDLINDGLQRDRRSEAIGIRLHKARNDRNNRYSLGRPHLPLAVCLR
jgi:hypothetical protein